MEDGMYMSGTYSVFTHVVPQATHRYVNMDNIKHIAPVIHNTDVSELTTNSCYECLLKDVQESYLICLMNKFVVKK